MECGYRLDDIGGRSFSPPHLVLVVLVVLCRPHALLYENVHLDVIRKIERPTAAVSTIVFAAFGTVLNGDRTLDESGFSITDPFLPKCDFEHLGNQIRIQTYLAEFLLFVRRQLIKCLVCHVRLPRVPRAIPARSLSALSIILADLLHETEQHHGHDEKTHAEHHGWDGYAPYLSARQSGSSPEDAVAQADRYREEVLRILPR
jgi:hypothetical protein